MEEARLVTTIQTVDEMEWRLRPQGGALVAHVAPNIAGQIEVRGVGIVTLPHVERAPLLLVVRLVDRVERLPVDGAVRRIAGVAVTEIALNGLEPSAPIKVELALKQVGPTA